MAEKKENKQKKKTSGCLGTLTIAVLLLTAAAAGCYVVSRINVFTLSISLLGQEDILLEYGDPYEDPGVRVFLSSTLFWEGLREIEDPELVITDGRVDGMTGRFLVEYEARYLGLRAKAQRVLRVVDTQPPVITLAESSGYMVKPGNIYEEPGYSAMDNCDGDITDRVVCTVEEELITYAVTDRAGNPAVVKRVVPDYDPVPPRLELTGQERMVLTVGTPYTEPGCRATDHDGTDLTEQVKIEGNVNWLVPGIYPVVYTVSDEAGNTTTLARKVTIVAEPRQKVVKPEGKVIYLTFDDGPGPETGRLLDILDQYGVNATFFVVGKENGSMMQQITQRGHSIGIHSITHDYSEIYSSPEAFFGDLYGMQEYIYQQTGVRTTLMRFPGGSSNEISVQYQKGIMSALTEAVQDAGFQYFDWNVLSGDAGQTQKTEEVVQMTIDGIRNFQQAMVLQHDIHKFSVDAVEQIILWGLDNGYRFLPVEANSPGFHQHVAN